MINEGPDTGDGVSNVAVELMLASIKMTLPGSLTPERFGELSQSCRLAAENLLRPSDAPMDRVEPAADADIKRSINPDYLVSFIDGRRYKSLKRHLSAHGLDPVSYRKRYGLPINYPTVAPNYAKHRSELAKASGLGQRKPKAS